MEAYFAEKCYLREDSPTPQITGSVGKHPWETRSHIFIFCSHLKHLPDFHLAQRGKQTLSSQVTWDIGMRGTS